MILASTLPRERPPSTPGEILLEDFLRPLGLTQAELAERTGLGPRCVNEICRGKRAITARSAILLSDEFGTTVEYWINLQCAFDLWMEIDRMGRRGEIPSPPMSDKKTRAGQTPKYRAAKALKKTKTSERTTRTRSA